MHFAHTPYDGSKKPFTVGLEPLGDRDWIVVDERIALDLNRKEQFLAEERPDVFHDDPATREAQAEVLQSLVHYLPERYPDIYRRDGRTLDIIPAGRAIDIDGADAPLVAAARLIQEDLCLMRRGNDDCWRLAAGVVCFPSGWLLPEKFGASLAEIHRPVPDYAGKMANVVTRIFDQLRPDTPLLRFNWSIHGEAELHQPAARHSAPVTGAQAFIRVERQILKRLSVSGDVLFTIRTHVDRIADMATHPRGRNLALGLRAQLLALTDEQAAYKGLAGIRDQLDQELQAIIRNCDKQD